MHMQGVAGMQMEATLGMPLGISHLRPFQCRVECVTPVRHIPKAFVSSTEKGRYTAVLLLDSTAPCAQRVIHHSAFRVVL